MRIYFCVNALRRYAGVDQSLLRISAHPRIGGQVPGDAPNDGCHNLPGVATVASLPENQRRRLSRLQCLAESCGYDHGEQDGRAVQRAVGISFSALLYFHLGQRIQPLHQFPSMYPAVQVYNSGRSEDLALTAQRAIHQGKKQDRQGHAESQFAAVVQEQLEFQQRDVEGAKHNGYERVPGKAPSPLRERAGSSVKSFAFATITYPSRSL